MVVHTKNFLGTTVSTTTIALRQTEFLVVVPSCQPMTLQRSMENLEEEQNKYKSLNLPLKGQSTICLFQTGLEKPTLNFEKMNTSDTINLQNKTKSFVESFKSPPCEQ